MQFFRAVRDDCLRVLSAPFVNDVSRADASVKIQAHLPTILTRSSQTLQRAKGKLHSLPILTINARICSHASARSRK